MIMSEDGLKLREGFYLAGVRPDDKFALLEHLKAKEIYDATLNIPYPYSEADADRWIRRPFTAPASPEVAWAGVSIQ